MVGFMGLVGGMAVEVVIVKDYGRPNETRTKAKAVMSGQQALFDVKTPVYEGDVLEWPDPRGGVRRASVKVVNIHENPIAGGIANCIEVKLGVAPL